MAQIVVGQYPVDVLWGQLIKLAQVTSTSELHESQWNHLRKLDWLTPQDVYYKEQPKKCNYCSKAPICFLLMIYERRCKECST